MLEKRDIRIYDFSNRDDRHEVEKMFRSSLEQENLTPIIGSGFTKGLRTKNGTVPSMEELEAEMKHLLHLIDGSIEDEFESTEIKDLADIFWEGLGHSEKVKFRGRFQEYIENNFTKVYDMEQAKKHFLNSDWKIIFTLNYDDAIENVLDIEVAVPYDNFNIRSGKNCLIKLHGDARRYCVTGNPKYCVMGSQQYVSLIKEPDNADIVNALKNTFLSKSVLFVGCSLSDELDLLYSAGMQLGQKIKQYEEHHIIYLLYSDEIQDDDGLKKINPIPYKKYGITDIVWVTKDTIIELYESVYAINKERKVLRESDLLKDYTNIRFEYLDGPNKDNIDYLFFDDKINIKEGVIKLPAFFTERSCIKKLEKEMLSGKGVLYIIYGTKFSGKTYALLQLLKNLTSRKVYYFPSYIDLGDDIIKGLPEKENAIYLIDDGALSFEQYRDIVMSRLNQLEEKNIKIVLTINKGDLDFYRYYKNIKDLEGEQVRLYELANKFDVKEEKPFNEMIGKISLVPYRTSDTLLDYLFKAEAGMLEKKQKLLPGVNFLRNDCEGEVRTLIILATNGALTSRVAIDLGVDDILSDFTHRFSLTVQRDYLSNIEKKTEAYSGFKFVLNSSYWAIKSLSSFAANSTNHKIVVNAYRNIVGAYSSLQPWELNNRIKRYYMLDRIQWLFSELENKGAIRLPYLIYEGIHGSLDWNYQFLHQEAKCELRMARRENGGKRKKEIYEQAYRNIERALKLAEESTSIKIEHTVAHMNVTKALILINYVFMGEKEQFKNTVSACYDAFVIGESLIAPLERDEMKDFKEFIECDWNYDIGEDREIGDKLNELYTRYIARPSWTAKNII